MTHLIVLDFHKKEARRYVGRKCDMHPAIDGQPTPEQIESVRTAPASLYWLKPDPVPA